MSEEKKKGYINKEVVESSINAWNARVSSPKDKLNAKKISLALGWSENVLQQCLTYRNLLPKAKRNQLAKFLGIYYPSNLWKTPTKEMIKKHESYRHKSVSETIGQSVNTLLSNADLTSVAQELQKVDRDLNRLGEIINTQQNYVVNELKNLERDINQENLDKHFRG